MSDDDSKIELNRRRVLGGIVTVGAAAAAAGAGTFAAFSDTESRSGTLSAGTLDLQAGNSNSISFTASDIAPTDSGTANLDLEKSGNVTADLTVEVVSVSSTEGDNPDSETNTDADDGGELADQLELDLWIGTGGSTDTTLDEADCVLNSDGTVSENGTPNAETASNYDSATWTDVITDTDFSGPVTFNVDWNFPDTDSNNAAQGDDIAIDFEFRLNQRTS